MACSECMFFRNVDLAAFITTCTVYTHIHVSWAKHDCKSAHYVDYPNYMLNDWGIFSNTAATMCQNESYII